MACADAARAMDAVRRLNLPKNARVAAVSPPSSNKTRRSRARRRSRGLSEKRLLGASVADLCAASARRGAGAGAAPVWRADGARARSWTRSRARRAGRRSRGPSRAPSSPRTGAATRCCSLHLEGRRGRRRRRRCFVRSPRRGARRRARPRGGLFGRRALHGSPTTTRPPRRGPHPARSPAAPTKLLTSRRIGRRGYHKQSYAPPVKQRRPPPPQKAASWRVLRCRTPEPRMS